MVSLTGLPIKPLKIMWVYPTQLRHRIFTLCYTQHLDCSRCHKYLPEHHSARLAVFYTQSGIGLETDLARKSQIKKVANREYT